MGPSSARSFDQTHTDLLELQSIPSSRSQTAEQRPPGTRVGFSGAANAETHPLEHACSSDHSNQPVSSQTDGSQHAVVAKESLNADIAHTVLPGSTSGVFCQLLQSYKTPTLSTSHDTLHTASIALPAHSPKPSGMATPFKKKWYKAERETLATLVGASARLANPNDNQMATATQPCHHTRTGSGKILAKVWKTKGDEDARIKIHVADMVKRQRYIVTMCRALMLFGAPSHRLEEYLATTAKILEVNSQFLYIPGCMIISFDDVLTHTAEVKIVRITQGVNLGKLIDTHQIYKEVLHDVISLDEALIRLDGVISAEERHPVWLTVIMYGLASATVSVFFKARVIDMPIIFALGCVLGLLQLVVAPLSKTYSTVFDISATILMSFSARAIGSIKGGSIFCFSAIAQSAIAMILPGWVSYKFQQNSHGSKFRIDSHSLSSVRPSSSSLALLCLVLSGSSLPSFTPSSLDTASTLAPPYTAPLILMPRMTPSATTH